MILFINMIKLKNIINESVNNPRLLQHIKIWIGDSKIKDDRGNPVPMYHVDRQLVDVDKLEPWKRDGNAVGDLLWFSDTPLTEYGDYIYRAYLKLINPINYDNYKKIETWGGRSIESELTRMGYDGFLDWYPNGKINIAAVLSNKQIYIDSISPVVYK